MGNISENLKYVAFFIYLAVISSCSPAIADVRGDLNPAVTQQTINKTICISNWTREIRPSSRYTNKIKFSKMKQLGIPWSERSKYELDHWVALGIGGAPSAVENLVLMPHFGKCNADDKNKLESYLHRAVCAGKISLVDAQLDMQYNWVASYHKYIGPLYCK